jgi:hypothetical protein
MTQKITYPYLFHLIAKELSTDRTKGMHKNYKGKEYYSGSDTKKYNVQGVLAELIAQEYFLQNDTDYKALTFLGTEPEVEADIIVGNRKIDVKYIPTHGKLLIVNYNAHNNKNKDVNEYMFIQPFERFTYSTAKAYIWFIKHDEVNNWNVEQQTRTKVYEKKIKDTF